MNNFVFSSVTCANRTLREECQMDITQQSAENVHKESNQTINNSIIFSDCRITGVQASPYF